MNRAQLLPSSCLPGCFIEHDGEDDDLLCVAHLAIIPMRADVTGEPCALAVEVEQVRDADGSLSRRVRLLPMDRRGGYHGDGLFVDAAGTAALIGELASALAVATEVDR